MKMKQVNNNMQKDFFVYVFGEMAAKKLDVNRGRNNE